MVRYNDMGQKVTNMVQGNEENPSLSKKIYTRADNRHKRGWTMYWFTFKTIQKIVGDGYQNMKNISADVSDLYSMLL